APATTRWKASSIRPATKGRRHGNGVMPPAVAGGVAVTSDVQAADGGALTARPGSGQTSEKAVLPLKRVAARAMLTEGKHGRGLVELEPSGRAEKGESCDFFGVVN